MRAEELRQEILRLEERRLRMAPEVMGGDPEALEEDRRLERRIRELAHLAEAPPERDGGDAS
jgi:hypothetical protein